MPLTSSDTRIKVRRWCCRLTAYVHAMQDADSRDRRDEGETARCIWCRRLIVWRRGAWREVQP